MVDVSKAGRATSAQVVAKASISARKAGREEAYERLKRASEILRSSGMRSMRPLLPLMLSLRGKPFDIDDHFPFEPVYDLLMPRTLTQIAGRQVAKCLALSGKQKILLANGRRVAGEQLRTGDKVLAINDRYQTRVATVLDTIRVEPKPILQITTRTGVVLDMAGTHPLLKLTGWTTGDQLKVGDRIASLRRGGTFGTTQVSRERLILTAYLIGDGCCVRDINVTSECPQVIKEAIRCIQWSCGVRPTPILKPGTKAVRIDAPTGCGTAVIQWLKEDGLYGGYAWEKFIPAWAYQLSRKDTALFLSRLWATDGTIKADKTKPQISYTSTSRELAYDVKSLLLKFGIPSSVSQKKAGYRNKVTGEYIRCRDAYLVRVETRDGWLKFLAEFDVPGKPAIALRDVLENNNRDTIPLDVRELIAEIGSSIRQSHQAGLLTVGLRAKPKHALSYRKLQAYVDHFRTHCADHPRLPELERLLDGDVLWDEIVSIERKEAAPCWDIEVSGEHNYVVDGVVSHNSTSAAARGLMLSNHIPYFNTLFITPLYEMIRRFSSNYMRPFIDQSPVKNLWTSTSTENSVLQRSFKNQSRMIFSFAFHDADRVRGVSSDFLSIDEAQDMDFSLVPIIGETQSASKWKLKNIAGTPKSMENGLQTSFERSSQAEWVIPCFKCHYENVPALAWDLDRMIGDNWKDASEEKPGIICAKCGRPIFPRRGMWRHRYPERRLDHAGYHIPQIIMPMHYASPDAWRVLLGKRAGADNTTPSVFYNEVCGVSYDEGAKLVTVEDLKRAGTLNRNTLEEALKVRDKYIYRVLGVDWGGGRRTPDGKQDVSFTVAAVMGMTPDGKLECIYGWKSLTPHDYLEEAREVLKLLQVFRCSVLAHDYNGAGEGRHMFIVHAGFPNERTMAMVYQRAARGALIHHIPANDRHPRDHWQVDKARSLAMTCALIKNGHLKFFAYDFQGEDSRGLMHDFTALVEDKVKSRFGSDTFTIIADDRYSDDFAHAVNFGAMALFHMSGQWPNLAKLAHLEADIASLEAASPVDPELWDQLYGYSPDLV